MTKQKKESIVILLAFIAFLFYPSNADAQEYKYEFGAAVGPTFYMGDANKTKFFQNPGIAGGLFYRQNLNFHWAIKGNLLGGTISGNSADNGYIFPNNQHASFNRFFIDLGGQIEFNFFPYSDKFSYLNARPYTPYIFTGVGGTFATGNKLFFNANVPIGIGFKYKLSNKMNVGAEFSIRKLFGDNFDVTEKNAEWDLDAPYAINSSFLKNQDWYSVTLIYVTWDFGLRHDPCCGQR